MPTNYFGTICIALDYVATEVFMYELNVSNPSKTVKNSFGSHLFFTPEKFQEQEVLQHAAKSPRRADHNIW